MTLFVGILLAILTFIFIVYPFFSRRLHLMGPADHEKVQELHSKRDTTYSMLKELEFDFQSGILSEEDYGELEARYKGRAISILRNIDDMSKGNNVEAEIERQVLELRRSKERFCPQCRTRYQKGARFCSHCGSNLEPGGHV